MSEARENLVGALSFAVRVAANSIKGLDDETGDGLAKLIVDRLDEYLASRDGHPYRTAANPVCVYCKGTGAIRDDLTGGIALCGCPIGVNLNETVE
jgi:hypothetical protein